MATMQESDPTAESSASEEKPRQWKITTTQAMIVGPVLGALVGVWGTALVMRASPNLASPNLASPALAHTPDLAYTVDDKIEGEWRTVTIEIANRGDAPSENVSGWIEFPSGELPQAASGPKDFEVRVGALWKRLGRQTGLRSSETRVYFRNQHLQPGLRYTLTFYAKGEGLVDTGKSTEVYLGDDTGKARRASW